MPRITQYPESSKKSKTFGATATHPLTAILPSFHSMIPLLYLGGRRVDTPLDLQPEITYTYEENEHVLQHNEKASGPANGRANARR